MIGVPLDATSLNGLDALLATVQMPAGVPVATVAIGRRRERRHPRGADPRPRRREARRALAALKSDMAAKVAEKDRRLREKRRAGEPVSRRIA